VERFDAATPQLVPEHPGEHRRVADPFSGEDVSHEYLRAEAELADASEDAERIKIDPPSPTDKKESQ
jgi:hypothetical protein